MEVTLWIQLGALWLLFTLVMVFSGAEAALLALGRIRAKALAASSRGKRLEPWLTDPNRLLTSLLVGVNLFTISASSLASAMAIRYADTVGFSRNEAIAIAAGAFTLLLIIFGEITPKLFAMNQAERVAMWVIRPLVWFDRVAHPMVRVLTGIGNLVIRLLGQRPGQAIRAVTQEDIRAMLAAGERDGTIGREERQMITEVLGLGDTEVRSIMTPRDWIEAVDIQTNYELLLDLLVETGHSRMLVYDGTLDRLRGMIVVKDLLSVWRNQNLVMIEDLLRPVHLVTPETKVSDLLRDLRVLHQHLAVVVERGRVIGLVTLEDALEEIVGEITDEYDLKRAMGT